MCTNSALLESIECYMEDMVQCFEEFVKKTLFVVTVAAGALIAMVMYLMKNLNCRRRCVAGAETQMEDVFGSCLREGYSTSSIRTDKRISPRNSFSKTCSDFLLTGKSKCGKNVEICSSQNVLVNKPSCPKKSTPCITGKTPSCLKLPSCLGSSSKICVRKNPCRPLPCSTSSCSRTSSCESLRSRSSCRGSDSSICGKIPCASKSSCGAPFSCSPIPPCPPPPCKRSCGPIPGCKRSCLPAPTCKRSCSPAPCRPRSPRNPRNCTPPLTCARPCSPVPSCARTCSKIGRVTVPSLVTCNPPKYKLELPACATIKPCNTPKRCPSKPCFTPHRKGSCCSLCCDD